MPRIPPPSAPIPRQVLLPLIFSRPLVVLPALHRRWGPVVNLGHVKNAPMISVADPSVAEQVLTRSRAFGGARSGLRRLVGNSIIVSSGDDWLRKRRLMQPAFHRQQIAQMTDTIVGETDALIERWRGPTTVQNLSSDFRRLAQQIIVQLLFRSHLDTATADQTGAAFTTVIDIWSRAGARLIHIPMLTRRAHHIRDAAIAMLDAQVNGMIAARRQAPENDSDLLGMLLAARDTDGSTMTDTDVRDEVMGLFLAGHETTTHTLTWMMWLLACHPRVADQIRADTQGVPDTDLLRVPVLHNVINETLRLYPTVWIAFRTLEQDLEIDSYHFTAGSVMMVVPWVVQRDAQWWPDPTAFRPERWLEPDPSRPKYAFFPFGGGSRQCLGQGLAMAELAVIGTRLLHATRFTAPPKLHPVTRGALKPNKPFRVHVTVTNHLSETSVGAH